MVGELIKVDFKHKNIDGIAISTRELHKQLEIKKPFTAWFKYQCKRLKLVENRDYILLDKIVKQDQWGGHNKVDYITSIDIGKLLCMISESEKANEIRWYFIEVEKKWNSPDAVIARALEFSHQKNLEYKEKIDGLELTLLEQKPKVDYCDYVLRSENLVNTTVIAKDYGYKSAQRLNKILYEEGIQYKSGDVWVLYSKYCGKGYTKTETKHKFDRYGNPTGKVYLVQKWTQKGRMFIYEILKERRGLIPTMERSSFREVEVQQTMDDVIEGELYE